MKKLISGFVLFLNAYTLQAADFYWTGGTGDWNNFAGHWATSSGGSAFHAAPPGPNDNVFFDGASFTAGGIITISQPNVFCKDFTWFNVAPGSDLVTTDTSYKISVFGSIVIDVQTDISYDGVFSFESPHLEIPLLYT